MVKESDFVMTGRYTGIVTIRKFMKKRNVRVAAIYARDTVSNKFHISSLNVYDWSAPTRQGVKEEFLG